MPAVYLVLWACLGQSCERVELLTDVSPAMCSMSAQLAAAEWINHNMPGAQLRYWRCILGHPA